MILEDELTRSLQDLAGSAPPTPELASGALRRSRRLRARRYSGAAAALTAVGVLGVAEFASPFGTRDTLRLSEYGANGDFLQPAGEDLTPTFRYTPAFLPEQLSTVVRMSSENGSHVAEWTLAKDGRDGALSGLTITITAAPNDHSSDERDAGDTTVQAQRAKTYTGTAMAGVQWQASDGRWVQVTGFNSIGTRDTVLRVAQNLQHTSLRATTGLHFTTAPNSYALTSFFYAGATLTSTAGAEIAVTLRPESAEPARGEHLVVDGRDAWFAETDGRTRLVLEMPDRLRLHIDVPAGAPWDRPTLARFASGVTYDGPVIREG